ncbi:flavin reductase family protein [Nocardioides sp. KR10-350]|uniref:flavin reductase family protein n=1 Tax=Nocardioides cheoyonin TaxID=3156615 RepID=UPI0032B394E5
MTTTHPDAQPATPDAKDVPVTQPALATNQDLDPQRLRQAFGIFPTGVVAVAAEVDGRLTGLAASSFTSVSLDPPLVSFSVANSSKTWPQLRRAAHLGVTILSGDQGAVCRQLAGPVGQRFDGVRLSASDDGAVTLDEGLARFDCTIYREVEAGDHVIVLLRLHAVEHSDEGATGNPLVFHRSGFGRLAESA